MNNFSITALIGTGPSQYRITVKGRVAWALSELLKSGPLGCTPITRPAPRWSSYVHILRHDYDVEIETIIESHGGQFPGYHGRYILRTPVQIVEPTQGV